MPLHNNALFQIVQACGALQLVQDGAAVAPEQIALGAPIKVGAQTGGMNEDVERLAALWCDAWVSECRCGEVSRWVRGRLALVIDGVELLFRITGEHKVMVEQVIVALLEPEIEHNTRAGRLVALAIEGRTSLPADQLAVGAEGVHVGDDSIVALQPFCRHYACDAVAVDLDLVNVRARLQSNAEFRGKFCERLGNG